MNSDLSEQETENTSTLIDIITEFKQWFSQYSTIQEMFTENDYNLLQEYSSILYGNNFNYVLRLSLSNKLAYKQTDKTYCLCISKYYFFFVSFYYFINHHNHTKEKPLIHFLIKLYENQYLTFIDIEKIITRFIEVSLLVVKAQLKKIHLFLFALRLFIHLVENNKNHFDSEKSNSINRILFFIDSSILSNKTNCFILSQRKDFLNILSLINTFSINNKTDSTVSKIIFDLLLKVYSYSYSDVIFRHMMTKAKKVLINIDKAKKARIASDIILMRNQLYLILQMIQKEEKEETLNQIKAGFVFTNSLNSGLTISDINLNLKNNIILFSFNQYSQQNNEKAVLFNSSNSKHPNLLSCYIKNTFLNIQFGKNTYQSQYCIELNTFYYVYIFISKSLFKTATVRLKINHHTEEFKCTITSEDADTLTFGFISKDRHTIQYNTLHFEGILGPLLYFNCIFGENDIDNIYKDSTHYELILSNTKCKSDNILGKELIQNRSAYYSYEKYMDNLALFLNPYTVINAFKSKKEYHDTYSYTKHKKESNIFCKIKYTFNSLPISKNFGVYPFVNLRTISQFIEYDGIDYLTLNIEYYYTLIRAFGTHNESSFALSQNM